MYHFKINFDCLYEEFEVNETLKTHVILEHFSYYFKNKGTNFRITNGEFFEAAHYSKKKHEVDHGYVVKKKQGTKHHLLKSLQSLSSYNSIRIGSTPPRDLTLKKRRTPSPSPSTPTKKGGIFPKFYLISTIVACQTYLSNQIISCLINISCVRVVSEQTFHYSISSSEFDN